MQMRKILYLLLLFLIAQNALAAEPQQSDKQSPPYGVIDPQLLKTANTDGEKLRYDVFWTGGMKIGELTMEIRRLRGEKAAYQFKAVITTENGAIHGIYPVRDVHVTTVRGPDRLPSRYEVRQKEGYNYQASRMTKYHQVGGKIVYRKNADPPIEYSISGPTHNEFSAFFASRVMPFAVGESFIVPTFADKKRNEVKVKVVDVKKLEKTLLGEVETMKVTPILEFKGLYDKSGDTVIWYTNDECRVPVRINSKLVIGSLTCELVAYENPACGKYAGIAANQKTKNNVVQAGNTSADKHAKRVQ
jgi:hypothetical protein